MRLSVIIPTLNAAAGLPACLDALLSAALKGVVTEVIISDGGSTDQTAAIADAYGARLVRTAPGRGGQLRAGIEAAKGDWFLTLHADTVLSAGWEDETARFMDEQEKSAAVFTLRFDDDSFAARLVSTGTMLRTRIFKSPYGDQGLLITRTLYEQLGGYADLPFLEDVDFMRRLKRKEGGSGFSVLKSHAVTSAARYRREGYSARVLRNMWCLILYRLGQPPEEIAVIYERRKPGSQNQGAAHAGLPAEDRKQPS